MKRLYRYNGVDVKMSDEMTTLNLRIPQDLRRKFKSYASLNGETMTDILIKMIKEYIEENENKSK